MSTAGQDLDGQPIALAVQGVESGQVFTDKLSGAVNTDRPGRAAQLHYAREGDTVVVTAPVARLTRRHRYRHTYRPRGGRHHGHPAELPKLDPDPHRAVQCSAYSCWPPRLIDSETTPALATDDPDNHARPPR